MSPFACRRSLLSFPIVLALAALGACTGGTPIFDAGMDARRDATGDSSTQPDVFVPDGAACTSDPQCNDNLYCNGVEHCSNGFCIHSPAPCDDHASCTDDLCDEGMRLCTHVPHNEVCGDMNACDGIETCNPLSPGAIGGTGCQPVHMDQLIDCDDANNCTIDECDPTIGCVHSPRDLDGDGYVDQMCTVDATHAGMRGNDCDDSDPTVHPGAVEICTDGKDNNCNGLIDYADTAFCSPTNDTCATARVFSGPGTYWLSTVGLTSNYNLSCATGSGPQGVFTFTLTMPQDVRITTSTSDQQAAMAIGTPCDPTMFSETTCRHATLGGEFGFTNIPPAIFIRSLPAGTYTLVVQSSDPDPFQLIFSIGTATVPPPGDTCPPASMTVDLVDGVPSSLVLSTLTDDYSLACNTGTSTPDGVFHFNLATSRNVNVSVTAPTGTIAASIRANACPGGTELRCLSGSTVSTSLRNLAAGDYYIIVKNSAMQTVTATITTSDPGMRVTGDACVSPAVVSLGPTFPVSGSTSVPFTTLLSGADSGTSCGSGTSPDGWWDAIYSYTLPGTGDVNISVTPTGWSPPFDWQLENTCGGSAVGTCDAESGGTGNRTIFGQPAGTYYLVVETNTAPAGTNAFRVDVTATDSALRPTYEACPGQTITLTPSGTSLVGSATVNAGSPALSRTAQVGTSCGSGSIGSGWTDVVFAFTLTSTRAVHIDLATSPGAGSTFWFVEVDSGCSQAGHTGPCEVEPAGGIGGGFSSGFDVGRLAAGTYVVVAETTTTPVAQVGVTVTATP